MCFLNFSHYGAVPSFTGSYHELSAASGTSYLIDCALFQDAGTSSTGQAERDALHSDFLLNTVRALNATHVHIDHVGRIPYLLAAGFKEPILCSEPFAKLLPASVQHRPGPGAVI